MLFKKRLSLLVMVFIVVCSIASVGICSIDSVTEIYDFVGCDFDLYKSVTVIPEDYMTFMDLLFKLLIPVVNNIFCLNIAITF
jgi:hypothetical protein